jgi:hypothetical protein
MEHLRAFLYWFAFFGALWFVTITLALLLG